MDELRELELKQKKEVADVIKNGYLYDYIFSNQYRLDDGIIRDLLLECIAVLTDDEKNKDKLIDNLKEYKEWEI